MASVKALSKFLQEAGYCSGEVFSQWLQKNSNRASHLEKIADIFVSDQDVSKPIRFVDSISALASSGVTELTLLKLLNSRNATSLLLSSPQQIADAVTGLGRLGFTQTERARLVAVCPEIFQTPVKTISESYLWMRQTFTDRQARQLVFSSPGVLVVDKASLIERANYLFARMRVIGREVAHSGALGHSLDKIRCRHMFLLRSGRYEFPDAKARLHRLGKNPTLKEILDSSDQDFVQKVARLSLAEYVVFQKILNEEDAFDDEEY